MISRPRNLVLLLVIAVSALVAAVVGAVVLYLQGDRPEWTSSSPAAIKELEAGLEDYRKVYYDDALRHFERALELDEEFAVPLAMLSRMLGPGERRQALVARLEAVDLEPLTDRERFLVELARARLSGEDAVAERLLDGHLVRHPDDPWAVAERCQIAWVAQDWEVAERCYEGLIAAHPNWVVAQNILGYIDLSRGRFTEAEDHFRTYRFIAPDQANPYDSLGELLTVLGRYEEAEETIEQGLELKRDFCASYLSLGRLYFYWNRPEDLRRTASRLRALPACERFEDFACRLDGYALAIDGDPEAALEVLATDCLGEHQYDLVTYLLALDRGDEATQRRLETALDEGLAKLSGLPKDQSRGAAVRDHLRGVRALHEGRPREAVALLQTADRELDYRGDTSGGLKLTNRLFLAFALRASGEEMAAEATLQKIAAVNPRYLEGPFLVDLAQRAVDRGRP